MSEDLKKPPPLNYETPPSVLQNLRRDNYDSRDARKFIIAVVIVILVTFVLPILAVWLFFVWSG